MFIALGGLSRSRVGTLTIFQLMTTKLTKAVSRQVLGGEFVVTLEPAGVSIRKKGSRTDFPMLSYDYLYEKAAQMHAGVNLEAPKKTVRQFRASRSLLG